MEVNLDTKCRSHRAQAILVTLLLQYINAEYFRPFKFLIVFLSIPKSSMTIITDFIIMIFLNWKALWIGVKDCLLINHLSLASQKWDFCALDMTFKSYLDYLS